MSTLEPWFEHGWLKRHRTSAAEIQAHLASVERDLADAGADISAPRRALLFLASHVNKACSESA
ncbi:MAG: hypothetical protein GTN78_24675 [Gemmatimonadales bacterium]|nr:hypothetical protein [Gemmatimonadales bacterium]NIN12134.1 hypothetical protein [Gemmatimonadales bacterium]NIR03355.1 hypothetical protein [Gemmatimonadales bacterium]NIS67034.1 hypothetical protein [Gemmatimonadales bacterium]